jgi:hypothetical protein
MDKKKELNRGVPAPLVGKAGVTRKRRRLESGGKLSD